MNKKIKDLDLNQRPREKLKNEGYASLSDEELLAILIETGSKKKNAIELAREILNTFSSEELLSISIEQLNGIDGIKLAKASKIIAAIQLGKRLTEKIINKEITSINSCEDVFNLMKNKFIDTKKEHFYAILLDTKNVIISKELISTGDLNSSIVNPRECFISAVKKNPNPSCNDKEITQRLIKAGEILDIKVLDHIIIGNNKYFSFRQENII